MQKLKIMGGFLGVFIIMGGISEANAITNTGYSDNAYSVAELQQKIRMLTEQIQALQMKLRSLQSTSTMPVMHKEIRKNVCFGARNDEDVKTLQTKLKESGHFKDEATGNYFKMTHEAVRKYQMEHGITPADCVGPKTREKLHGESRDPKITPMALRTFHVGVFAGEKLMVHGFSSTTDITWQITSGALPSGITLDRMLTAASCTAGAVCPTMNNIAHLQGTPATVGEYAFTIKVSDGTKSVEQKYVLRVKPREHTATTSTTVQ